MIDSLIAAQPTVSFNQIEEDIPKEESQQVLDLRFQKSVSWFNETDENSCMSKYKIGQFEELCLGGTFDHMHSGHNMMLT